VDRDVKYTWYKAKGDVMKKIAAECVVDDLYGLVEDLKKRSFKILNVATDQRGTYIYLDDAEEKDPLPVVVEWVGKPAPKMTLKEWQARVKASQAKGEGKRSFFGRILAFLSKKNESEVRVVGTLVSTSRPSEQAQADPAAPISEMPVEPPPPIDPQFFRKIL